MTAPPSIAIVGLGGLGCPAALAIAGAARSSVSELALWLIDDEVVDLSNLHRQVLYGDADIGRPKVEVARERLAALAPSLPLVARRERLDASGFARLAAEVAVIVDGTDAGRTKLLLADGCVAARRPFVHAGVVRLAGHVLTVVPGLTPCVRCFWEEADAPSDPASDEGEICAADGVLGSVAGVVGALAGEAALALVRFTLDGKLADHPLVRYDARTGIVRRVAVRPRPGCLACDLSHGRSHPLPLAVATPRPSPGPRTRA